MNWLISLFGGEALWRAFSISRKQAVLLIGIAASLQVAVVIWAALSLAIDAFIAFLPAHPMTQFTLQFLPNRTVINSGLTFYFASVLSLKMWEMWKTTIRKAIGMTTDVWSKM